MAQSPPPEVDHARNSRNGTAGAALLGQLLQAAGIVDGEPRAAELIAEFETLAGVLQASPERLSAVAGKAATGAIDLLSATLRHVVTSRLVNRPLVSGSTVLLEYIQFDMAERRQERLRVLFLDAGNHLIRDEVVADGTIDEVSFHVREVVRRALELGSAAVILVHNHPGGDLKPSRGDVTLTRDLMRAGSLFGITLLDHLIVARTGHASLRAQGFLS